MKNGNKNQKKADIPREDLESLLHQVLREDGAVFPTSEEDIRNLEADLSGEEIEVIDPSRLLARVRGEETKAKEKIVPLFGDVSKEVNEDLQAMAARNGGQLTEDIRRQMEEDRANAEKRLNDQKKHE